MKSYERRVASRDFDTFASARNLFLYTRHFFLHSSIVSFQNYTTKWLAWKNNRRRSVLPLYDPDLVNDSLLFGMKYTWNGCSLANEYLAVRDFKNRNVNYTIVKSLLDCNDRRLRDYTMLSYYDGWMLVLSRYTKSLQLASTFYFPLSREPS